MNVKNNSGHIHLAFNTPTVHSTKEQMHVCVSEDITSGTFATFLYNFTSVFNCSYNTHFKPRPAHVVMLAGYMPLVTVKQLLLFGQIDNQHCMYHYVTQQPNNGYAFCGWDGESKQSASQYWLCQLETIISNARQ